MYEPRANSNHQAAVAPRMSRIAYGLWRLNEQGEASKLDVRKRIDACLELGITTFDHADIYGDHSCEATFGKALQENPSLREQMQLVTKCGIRLASPGRPMNRIKHYDTSWEHIHASVENSLRNLHTDHVDLLLLHRPDPLMDAEETAQALDDLVAKGKVLSVGVSNFSPWQAELLASKMRAPLRANQVEVHLLRHSPFLDGTLDQCQRLNMVPMAWSPLAGGRLQDEAELAERSMLANTLRQVSEELGGATSAQICLAWLLRHPSGMVPVIGTGKVARIQELAAAQKLTLSREQWFALWSAAAGKDIP